MAGPGSWTRMLSDVSGRLGHGDGTLSVAEVVLPTVVAAFGADVGSMAQFRAPSTLRLVEVVGMDHRPQVRDDWAEFDVSAGVPMAEAARTAEPVWVDDVEADRARFPAWPKAAVSRSACVVPMCSGGRLVGVLGLGWAQARTFTDEEKDALRAVGNIAAAACVAGQQAVGRRLGVVDSATDRDDVHLAHLVRSSLSAVPRTVGTVVASGAPTLSWLVEAPNDPALATASEGVLALARRRGTPPGLAARAIADLSDEIGGEAAGVVLQVGPRAGWVAVAGVNDCVVLTSPVMAGPGVTAFAGGSDSAADEHVVVPDGEGASVLALLLSPAGTEQVTALVDLARVEFERRRGATAEDLLERVGERLGEHGLDGALLGALALVVAPRPGVPVLRRRLPARPVAVPLARRFALAALGADPDPDLVFRLGLAVDELVSNATRHADESVELVVRPDDDEVLVEVSDDDDRGPQRSTGARGPGLLAESGRGLVLVDALVDGWGVRLDADTGGKTVWARVRR